MKNKILLVMFLMSLNICSVFAQKEISGIKKESQVTDPVLDQMEITRSAIQYMIDSIRNNNDLNDKVDNPDFDLGSKKFNEDLSRNLSFFEKSVEADIVNPMRNLISKYYLIKKSTTYSKDQKDNLLYSLKGSMIAFSMSKQSVYNQLIFKLINTIGIDVEAFYSCMNKVGVRVQACLYFESKIAGSKVAKSEKDGRGVLLYRFFESEETDKLVEKIMRLYSEKYPDMIEFIKISNLSSNYIDLGSLENHQRSLLNKNCMTVSCTVLTKLMYKKFITLLRDSIDVGLKFKVDDGFFIEIRPTNGDYDFLLEEVDQIEYSAMRSNLPFLISGPEWDIVNRLSDYLNSPSISLSNCKQDVKRFLDDLYSFGNVKSLSRMMREFVERMVTKNDLTMNQLDYLSGFEKSVDSSQKQVNELSSKLKDLSNIVFPDSRNGQKDREINDKLIFDIKVKLEQALNDLKLNQDNFKKEKEKELGKVLKIRRSCIL